MSATAVLLIIGAAVVGPIEAQPKLPDNVWFHCRMASGEMYPESTLDWTNYERPRCKTETLPELCARAMKEIDAVWTWQGWAVPNGPRISCIPVPQGYRK